MENIMDSMMRSMMMPFGDMGIGLDPFAPMNRMMGMLEGNNHMMQHQQQHQQQLGHNPYQMMNPATMFGQASLFSGFPGAMPGGIVHSSFTSTSYTTDEHGRRQVYQESHASTQGPNGVKETKSAIRDSRSGHQEMSIGHHIQDKAHIKKKTKNAYTGEEEQIEDYVNLDDQEVDQFEQEWQQKTRSCFAGQPGRNQSMLAGSHHAPARLSLGWRGEDDHTNSDEHLQSCHNSAYVQQPRPSSSGHRSKPKHHKNNRTSPDLSPIHNNGSNSGGNEGKISKKIKEIKNKFSKKSLSSKDHQSKRLT